MKMEMQLLFSTKRQMLLHPMLHSTTDATPVECVTATIQAHSSAISVVAGTMFSIFAAVVANYVVFETILMFGNNN